MKGGALGLCVVVAAVLLGCGGDGGDDASTAGAQPRTAIDPQQQQRAETMSLALGDFPPGWRASDPDDSNDADFDKCNTNDLSGFTKVGDAESQEFKMGNSQISSSTSIYATDEEAKEVLDLGAGVLTDQSQADCFADSFREALQKDPDTRQYEVGDAELGELSFVPPTGVEESRAFQIVLPLEAKNSSNDVVVEAVVLHQGDALVALTTVGVDEPVNRSLRDALAQALAGKMAAAASA